MKYGRLEDGKIKYAPRVLRIGNMVVCNPTADQYAAHGWKIVVDEPPPAEEGHYVRPTGYDEDDTTIWRTYEQVQLLPPPPRRWTRLSIKIALAQAGMLAAARTYLSSAEVAAGYTAWEALTDCDYIEEGFGGAEKWGALLDGAAQALGRTRAEIDAFLDSLPEETA